MENKNYIGYISRIKSSKKSKTIYFVHIDENEGCKEYIVKPYNDFIGNNLLEHDRLSFNGSLIDGIIIMNNVPLIIACQDKEGLKKCFHKAIAKCGVFGEIRSEKLYSYYFEKAVEKNISVEEYINNESVYFKNKDNDLYHLSEKILTGEQHKKLLQWWYKKRLLRPLYIIGLNNKDIRNSHICPKDLYEFCKENPLRVINLSIQKCIEVFKHFNKAPTEDQYKEGIIARSLLDKLNNRGWTSTPANIMLKEFPDFAQHFQALMKDYKINMMFNNVYLYYPYTVENYIYKRLNHIYHLPKLRRLEDLVYKHEGLDDIQKKAIITALNENITIITGGAGTGKSTIINEIVYQLEKMHTRWIGCSFTGKAVQRMRQIIKPEAIKTKETKSSFYPIQTMHKFMYSYEIKNYPFEYLIIDEISMVSQPLFYEFLKEFEHDFKIIFVGDINQLEPIDWGNLFEQILKANCFSVVKLEKNYRIMVDGSLDGIVENANRIVDFEPDPNDPFHNLEFKQTSNFILLNENYERIIDLMKTFYEMNEPDINTTVLCPYKRYVERLNVDIQKIYRDESLSANRYITDKDGIHWCYGDRVSLTKNLSGVGYNGLEGRVIDLGYDEKENDNYVVVLLSENCLTTNEFKFYLTIPPSEEDLDDDDTIQDPIDITPGNKLYVKYIQHCYALTVHLSQGSEMQNIIIYIPENSESTKGSFLNKNLMYTAVTRAKRLVIVVGNINTFYEACTKKSFGKFNNLHLQFKALQNDSIDDMIGKIEL